MDKPIRKAVRCYLIKDNEVVVTKYKKGNKKEGYYDIPGGKIEEGETPKQTAIREMKEETGIEIQNLKYKGIMTIEYPDRMFIFDTFISKEYEGEPQEFEENTSEWIDIDELLKKEKILSNIILLDKCLIKGLIDDNRNFNLYIKVDEQENILGIDYNVEKIINKNIEKTHLEEKVTVYNTEFKDKLLWDLIYIETFSLILDIKIILMTVIAIFSENIRDD